MSQSVTEYQAKLRLLKSLRPKCTITACEQPSMLSKRLCAEHYRLNQESLAALHRFYDRNGAAPQPHIYFCPQCADETDDPSHLCKCLD